MSMNPNPKPLNVEDMLPPELRREAIPQALSEEMGMEVLKAVHFYKSKDDPNISRALNKAKETRRMSEPSVVVHAHAHSIGEACSTKCSIIAREQTT